VDEVVLVDNLSTDRTSAIIQSIQQEYPDKIVPYQYTYEICRRGREHWELASTAQGRRSPHLRSNYTNWCLAKCRQPYVLNWDGDMIATERFYEALQKWQQSSAVVMFLSGANVHWDRQHLIAARSSDATQLAEGLTVPVVPRWVTSMSYTAAEPRLFPRLWARYVPGNWWTYRLSSPFVHPYLRGRLGQAVEEPGFLHLKFCKRQPYTDYSEDFLQLIAGNLTVGPVLRPDWKELLRRWNI
jgi:glycosyltransferase involved in cell wall biosynthesis